MGVLPVWILSGRCPTMHSVRRYIESKKRDTNKNSLIKPSLTYRIAPCLSIPAFLSTEYVHKGAVRQSGAFSAS